MKAARFERFGDPAEVIGLVDLPAMPPAAGEATVRIEAAPIHLADLYCMKGVERFRRELPQVPGFEGVGRISAVGPGVAQKVGARVFLPLGCGAWREAITVPADKLIPAPEGDAAQVSLIGINPPTSYLVLKDYGDLKPGDWMIQNAANSNCGLYLIALAKLWGIKTINVVRRAELVPELKALGGDVALVDGDDLPARVKAATGNAPIKLALDAVNGMATARLAACLANGGTVLVYGMLTSEPCMIPADAVFMRDIRLEGFFTSRQFAKRTPEQIRAIYAELAQYFRDGKLAAKIAGVYPLAKVKDAVAHAGRRGADRAGKVILSMMS